MAIDPATVDPRMLRVSFRIERETETTFLYKEADVSTGRTLGSRDCVCGSLYIKKRELPSPPPEWVHAYIDRTERAEPGAREFVAPKPPATS
jgi:hypothetical protein